MSSDYISKSALIKTLTKYKFGAIENNDEREYTKEMVLLFVNSQPTVDEKEIIRKPFERVVERLECAEGTVCGHKDIENNCGGCAGCSECKMEDAYRKAIEIVKEECGISE